MCKITEKSKNIFKMCSSLPPFGTLYRKSDLCIIRNETAGPSSQFLHSCVCERLIYSQDRSAYLAAANWEYINSSQIHECVNGETEHYHAILEITRLRSFISGNT